MRLVTDGVVKGQLVNPFKVVKARVIHASPTSGKSTLVRELNADGVRILDTDLLISAMLPEWFELKPWRLDDTPQVAALNEAMKRFCGQVVWEVITSTNALVVTNLWGNGFRRSLTPSAQEAFHLPISLWVAPEEMVKRSIARGGEPFTAELADRWFKDWLDSTPCFNRAVILEEGEYLGSVLDFDFSSRPVPSLPTTASFAAAKWFELQGREAEGEHLSASQAPPWMADITD